MATLPCLLLAVITHVWHVLVGIIVMLMPYILNSECSLPGNLNLLTTARE